MENNKDAVHFGENVANEVKSVVNDEMKDILKIVVKAFSKKIKDKIPELPDKIEEKIKEMAGKPDIVDEKAVEWSKELHERGLIPKGYYGLPDELLIANFRQEGYLDGLYAGYALAMMALVDNNAEKELIISVRDDIRPNLIGHHYNDRDEFYKRYKSETYSWIERAEKGDN